MDTTIHDREPAGRPGHARSTPVLAWLRLARVFQKVDRVSSDEFRERGLSVAQFDVLAHVGALEGQTQNHLADSLLVTKGNVCQLLDRMERSGLLERRQDGRTNHLYLTSQGRALFNELVGEHEAVVARLFEGITPDEQAELLRILRKLDRSIA
jgi:DNA-binding MarR family transcriptional regulator